jgi:hypothetical protein
MNKRCTIITLALCALFTASQLNAQNCWAPLGSGIGSPTDLGGIFVSTVYNGNLIVAGQFDTAGGVPAANIAEWNGTSWSALGQGIKLRPAEWNGTGGIVLGLAEYNGELYASGDFDSAGGVATSNIARWNGTSWSPVGTGIPSYEILGPYDTVATGISSMAVYNGRLYVSGSFFTAGGVTSSNIASWDGSTWYPVGTGITGPVPQATGIEYITVINGKLYAGGDFETASGLPATNIAAWDGNAWTALGMGVGNDTVAHSFVTSIVSYQSDIYVSVLGNDPNYYNPIFSIEKWDGNSWSSVVGGPGTGKYYYGYVFSLLPFNGNLVAAGYYDVIGNDSSANCIAEWNGSTWSNLDNGPDSNEFQTLINYNNHLYAEGYFNAMNGTFANGIAEYTCATSAGIDEVAAAGNVNVYPNPTNGVINVSVESMADGATIQIYNLLGQRVLQSKLSSNKTEFNLTGQATGTYLYRLSAQSGENIGAGTFVIQ